MKLKSLYKSSSSSLSKQNHESSSKKSIKKIKEEPHQFFACIEFPPSKTGNPYAEEIQELQLKVKSWKSHQFFSLNEDKRSQEWKTLDDIGLALVEKYAWAIPDERALKIIKHFSPIVEVGSGKGYWAAMLRKLDVDIIAIDKFSDLHSAYTTIEKGGPERLKEKRMRRRALFLCYPDEQEAMAGVALETFTGEYIIHVGENISSGTAFGAPQAPFGRTSSADFQVSLAETFHCVLMANLKNRFPYSCDCISVWKRTNYVKGKDHAEDVGGEDDIKFVEPEKKSKKSKNLIEKEVEIQYISLSKLAELREAGLDQQYGETKDSLYAYIPEDEILPNDRAAPCLINLL